MFVKLNYLIELNWMGFTELNRTRSHLNIDYTIFEPCTIPNLPLLPPNGKALWTVPFSSCKTYWCVSLPVLALDGFVGCSRSLWPVTLLPAPPTCTCFIIVADRYRGHLSPRGMWSYWPPIISISFLTFPGSEVFEGSLEFILGLGQGPGPDL